ncbi:MAG: DUF2892 domain-containing protein [Clostridiales bacterium]|jgi:Ca2+/Na+ antiporter|nr:DUF2892 domain-containing protein [Clostridiales bacterium]
MNKAQQIFRSYRVKSLMMDVAFALLTLGLIGVSIWQWNVMLLMWAFLGWCVLYLIWRFLKGRNRNALFSILYDQCDARTYRDVYALILKSRKLKFGLADIKIELALGMIFRGEYQQALDLLNTINLRSKGLGKNAVLRCYNLMSKCYARLENWDMVERTREDIDILIKTGKLRSSTEKAARTALALVEAELSLHQRQLIKAREYHQNRLSKVKVLYQKVSIQYQLACIDLMEGDRRKAKERLEFVARNGGTMIEAELAREQLKNLEDVDLSGEEAE